MENKTLNLANYISNECIIKLLQLPKIGRKTALKILNQLSYKITCNSDLIDFVESIKLQFKLPEYSKDEFVKAFDSADEVLLKSDQFGIKIISFLDYSYPRRLLLIDDYPLILNYKGDIITLNDLPNIAIIGTREPTEYGYKLAKRLGEVFSDNGFNIVSGLAVGCDSAGHIGAVTMHKPTTAVLAHGLDSIYPKENKDLAQQIIENGGLLMSEYFYKQRPIGNFFVERDRIQAGLSDCVFVVETDIKGGTMHTVKFCQIYKRILACLNHPIEYSNQPKVQGNKMLIREGKAISVISKEDINSLINQIKSNITITQHNTINENQQNPNSVNFNNTQKTDFKPNNNNYKQLSIWD